MTKRILVSLLVIGAIVAVAGCDNGSDGVPRIVGRVEYPRLKTAPAPVPVQEKDSAAELLGDSNIPAGWLPPAYLEYKGRWKGIVIHHSATRYGCAEHEHKSHRANGWDGLGYHFVINNGIRRNGFGRPDGLVEVGDRWRGQKIGAHCRPKGDRGNYWNKHTIGICLIGNFEKTRATQKQMQSVIRLVRFLRARYSIPLSQIKGHGEIKPTKCPGKNFPMARFKAIL